MPIVKKSRMVDKAEYTIYGVDAEMVHQVLNGNVLNKLCGENMFPNEIEDNVFKSLSNNQRISFIAASEVSVAILKNVLGIDIGNLYNKLKDFENTGEFYSAYREHVVHQWRVFVLGLYLLETAPKLRKSLQHNLGTDYVEAWALTALCHDIGYLMERGDINQNKYADEIVEFLNSFENDEIGLSIFCPELDLSDLLPAEKEDVIRKAGVVKYGLQTWKQLFHDRDDNHWKLNVLDCDILKFENYYTLTTTLQPKNENRRCFIDHGIASAAIMSYLVERKLYWVEKVSKLEKYQYMQGVAHISPKNRSQAYQAIALHNVRPDIWDQNKAFLTSHVKLNTFKVRQETEPLAFLLILCDGLQEWNRPSRDMKNKLRKEMTSQDMHIISKEGNIYLCFPTDELARSASPDSVYNRITQPIKKILDYRGCLMMEISESEVGKYLDETLWIEEYRKIDTRNPVAAAYELYRKGRKYGNATRWEDGKRLHIDAAKLFQDSSMNDWASRSLGRAAVDALDLEQMPQADKLMEQAMELDPWQGTANYYWILEHCSRKDEPLEVIEKYFSQMLLGMQKLEIIDDAFTEEFERCTEEGKFCILWDKLILLFTFLLQKEKDWPAWSKSDQARQYVLMAERNPHESRGYLKLAEMEYRKVGLESYAAWTKAKCLFLESNACQSVEQMSSLLKNILNEEKNILQTPGGPRDIVRFSIKVNSFYYNVLMYFQHQDEKYKTEASVYYSAMDTFGVSSKYEYKEQCKTILEQIEENAVENECLLENIKNSVIGLAWLEKNKMKILLR